MRIASLFLLAAAAAACGGKSQPAPSGAPASGLERQYPALAFVPADAAYVITARQTREAAATLRELAAAGGLLFDYDMPQVDVALRQALGASFLHADDLAGAGIDLDRSMAVFGTGVEPTLVLPVRDPAALEPLLARGQAGGVGVRTIAGQQAYTVAIDGDLGLHWARAEDWLLVHVGPVGATAWLEQALSRPGQRIGTEPDLLAARDAASAVGDPPPVFGLVRPARLRAPVVEALHPMLAGCVGLVADDPIFLGAQADWDGARGLVAMELAPERADALRRHAVLPPAGFYDWREGAEIFAGWAIDLRWMAELAGPTACPLLGIGDRPGVAGGAFAGHAAGTDLDLESLEGRGTVHLGIPRQVAVQFLDMIPKRNWFERDERIGELTLKAVRVPTLEPLVYRLRDHDLTASYGKGIAEAVFAGGAEPPAGAEVELGAFAIFPGRIQNLAGLLRHTAQLVVGYPASGLADRSAARLARYEHGRLHLVLAGDRLILRAAMRVARRTP